MFVPSFAKLSDRTHSYEADTLSILKVKKGHNSVKMKIGLRLLLSAHWLVILYICTKFNENILNDFKIVEQAQFSY